MTVSEVIAEARRLGIALKASGETVLYSPRAAMTAQLAEGIRAVKPVLLSELEGTKPPAAAPSLPVPKYVRRATAAAPRATRGAEKAAASERWPDYDTTFFDRGRPKAGCKCGADVWIDIPIHKGQSLRRDCAACNLFLSHQKWYGVDVPQKMKE